MDKVMTIAEIESAFNAKWVLVADPQTSETLEVESGQVLYHSRDRDEFDRKVLEFHPQRFAVLFTGSPQADMEFVL